MKRLISFVVFLAFSLGLAAIVVRHDVDAKSFTVGSNEYRNVFRISLNDTRGQVIFEGTLIRSNWILTCAHFADNGILPNQNVEIENEFYEIDSIFIHPEYEGWDYDIALIRLKSSVRGVKPAELYSNPLEGNEILTIVGIGAFGKGDSGIIEDDGLKRKATNRINQSTSEWLFLKFDSPGSNHITSFEGVSGPGNSGGPAFVTKNGKHFIVGISSHSESSSQSEFTYGSTDFFSNVSSPSTSHWIEAIIKGYDYLLQMGTLDANEFFKYLLDPMIKGKKNINLSEKVKNKASKVGKRLKGCRVEYIGKRDKLYAVYTNPINNTSFKVYIDISSMGEIVDIEIEKIVKDDRTISEDIPKDSSDKLKSWGLPQSYVGLRMYNFFDMCLNASKENTVFFMENYYESYPGEETRMTAFFDRIASRIGEVSDIHVLESKKSRGSIVFKSGGLNWRLQVSINKTEPFKINGLSIDDGT